MANPAEKLSRKADDEGAAGMVASMHKSMKANKAKGSDDEEPKSEMQVATCLRSQLCVTCGNLRGTMVVGRTWAPRGLGYVSGRRGGGGA